MQYGCNGVGVDFHARRGPARNQAYRAPTTGSDGGEHARAADIIRGILTEDPGNDDALLAYAKLRRIDSPALRDPLPGVDSDPLSILDGLAARHPDQYRFVQARARSRLLARAASDAGR